MGAFRKAEKQQAKLRLALVGPAHSGKTYSALRLARGIVGPEGKIAVIDTERSSAALYAELTEFDVAVLEPPYSPSRYAALIKEAEKSYDIVVVDSLSHAWSGIGGILDIHDKNTSQDRQKNAFSAWRTTNKENDALIDQILKLSKHVICTVRTKTAYDFEVNPVTGKKTPVKIGLEPVQRSGLDYEFTIVGNIDTQHMCTASKDRTGVFTGMEGVDRTGFEITEEVGAALRGWLDSGRDPNEETDAEKAWRAGAESCKTVKELTEYAVGNQPDDVTRAYREQVWRRVAEALKEQGS